MIHRENLRKIPFWGKPQRVWMTFQFNNLYTVKKGWRQSRPQPGCHLPNSSWARIILLIIPAQGELVSDILAGDGNFAILFYSVCWIISMLLQLSQKYKFTYLAVSLWVWTNKCISLQQCYWSNENTLILLCITLRMRLKYITTTFILPQGPEVDYNVIWLDEETAIE